MLPSLSSFICLYPSFWIIAVSTQTYFHLKQTRKQTNRPIPLQPTSYNPSFWPISLLPLADILKRSVSPHSCQFLSSRGLWSTSPSGLPPTSLQKLLLCPSPQYLTQSVISLDFQDDLLGFPIIAGGSSVSFAGLPLCLDQQRWKTSGPLFFSVDSHAHGPVIHSLGFKYHLHTHHAPIFISKCWRDISNSSCSKLRYWESQTYVIHSLSSFSLKKAWPS